MTLPKGGRLFTALVDLKITLAFLFIDSIRATPDGNSINRKDDINILSNPVLFKKKLKMLHKNIDIALRYRAFYDKFMGIFRTPEVHQTGRMRKWVLSSQDLFLDNEFDLLGYMNDILNLSIWLDELIETIDR